MSVLISKYSDVTIPDDLGYFNFLFQGIKDHKNKVALIDDVTAEQITYGSLQDKVNTLACALYERGLRKGDVVCLFADKSILATVFVLALAKLGCVMTPCRPSHTAGELAAQVNNSGASIIVSDKNLMPTTLTTIGRTTIKNVYSIGRTDGYECLDDMLNSNISEMPNVPINPKEDLAFIIYSSGTTGLPKGAVYTHYSIIAGTQIISDPSVHFASCDVCFQNAPPYHAAGLIFISSYFLRKKTVVLYTAPSAQDLLLKAKQYKVTFLIVFANLLTELCKMSPDEIRKLEVDFSDLTFMTGGCVYNAVNSNEVLSKTGLKSLIQGYGSTEACGMITVDDETNFITGSAGLLISNYQMKIIDLTSKDILGPYQRGEVCVKGPSLMKGYLNNPDMTKETIDENGWLHMGDIGYYDETGHLFIVDRLKDVIKYQTMQVSPAEIEEVIYTHSAVKTVCVVRIDDDSAGEIPLACVIVKDGHTVSEQEITKLVEDNLADYKRLRGGVKFMTEFPLTSLGKIIRRELKENIKEELTSTEHNTT